LHQAVGDPRGVWRGLARPCVADSHIVLLTLHRNGERSHYLRNSVECGLLAKEAIHTGP
jgi:hypothetical protein